MILNTDIQYVLTLSSVMKPTQGILVAFSVQTKDLPLNIIILIVKFVA